MSQGGHSSVVIPSSESRPVQYVKGVGPKLAPLLNKLGIYTEDDLLYHFPVTYEDRRNMPTISQLAVNSTEIFIGRVNAVSLPDSSKKSQVLEAVVSDQTGQVTCVWFNQLFLKKVLKLGRFFLIKGKVVWSRYRNQVQIHVSDIEWLQSPESPVDKRIVPVYPLTAGVYQLTLRKLISSLLGQSVTSFQEVVPQSYLDQYQLVSLQKAMMNVHLPKEIDEISRARDRLIFDEFLYYQLQLARHRQVLKQREAAHVLQTDGTLVTQFFEQLPYQLTLPQSQAIQDVFSDLSKPIAMNRLVQGDVGSGKTDVAMAALLCAVDSGLKGIIMVPTEVLAVQHYLKFQSRFSNLEVDVFLLKSHMPSKQKAMVKERINSDDPCVIVGTHALIEDTVQFSGVGVCIIDEQHRFGVLQRMSLRLQETLYPHCLFMTATPIPRTFMLTCFGDLDKSIIDQLPPGRQPIKTFFVKTRNVEKVYQFCQQQLADNHQIYMVYPLVDPSEKLQLQSVTESVVAIQSRFSSYRVGMLHGRMSPEEKSNIMAKFRNQEYDILVATTVIEVGIDVPNATIMVINHFERFGLSQLHQLRGRVGRGEHASFCFLVGDPKTESGNQRTHAMLETNDGFKLAEYDLKIRGPGDMLGTRQSGMPLFKIGDIVRDEKVMLNARQCANAILNKDPHLSFSQHQVIAHNLRKKPNLFQTEVLN